MRHLCLVIVAVLAMLVAALPAGALPAEEGPAGDPDQAVINVAIEISRQRFGDAPANLRAGNGGSGGDALAGWGVLARTGVFADSLSGSGLTGFGPMLFTAPDAMDPSSLAELQRVLGQGDRVFLLGGTNALSAAVEEAVAAAGFVPVRLAGPSRIETSLAIALQIGDIGGSGRLALARADGPAGNPTAAWADSVTAGAWAAQEAVAVVLTPTTSLHPRVQERLSQQEPETTYLLGGPAAISEDTAAAVAATTVSPPVRIQGPNRYATAQAISEQLWGQSASGGYLITAGDAELGWAYGLAAAGLGAQLDRPLLLVETNRLPAETDTLLCASGSRADATVIGDTEIVSQAVRDALAAPC